MGSRLTRVAAWMGATTPTWEVLVVIFGGLDPSGAAAGFCRGCCIPHPSGVPHEPDS